MPDSQILYNPATRETRAIDVSGGFGEVSRLYGLGWKTYTGKLTQAQATAIVGATTQTQQAIMQPAPTAPQPTPLSKYVQNGSIDLIAVAQSGDMDAIDKARQLYGDKMSTAIYAGKKPVTLDTWMNLTDRVREEVRVVSPVSLREWNSLDDADKLRHYPESKSVKAAVAAKLGPGVLGRTAQYKPSVWEMVTPWHEEKGENTSAARNLSWLSEVVVPGVATVKYWNRMSVPEKVGNVALDLLIVGTFARALRGGVAALRPRFRTPKEVKAVIGDAVDAGKAHARLQESTKALSTADRLNFKVPGGLSESQLRHEVQLAANQSMKADTRFLRQLSGVKGLNTRDLAKIQRASKLPGIRKAIADVGQAQGRLSGMWKSLARWEKKMGYTPGKSRLVDVVYSNKLTNIQAARNKLDRAMVRFGEVARPRVKHTPAPQFEGYGMKWSEAFGGRDGLKPVLDDYDKLLKDSARYLDRKRVAEQIRIKDSRLWTLEKTTTKPKTGRHTLSLKAIHTEAKPAASLELTVPTIQRGRVRAFKMQLSEAAEIVRMTPAVVAQATPNVIAQFYSLKVISAVMAKPITGIDTETELRTAAQINAQYQAALSTGLKAATASYTETMKRTGDAVEARTAADTAARAAVDVYTASQVAAKVSVKVRAAVKTQARVALKAMLRPIPARSGAGYKVEKVEGVKADAGAVQFNSGIVKVTVEPPYRTADISYKRLKKAQIGKGSQEDTLKVVGGDPPAELVLSRGFDRVAISNGRRMSHSRQTIRGPRTILRDGRSKRQRRGSMI